MITCLTLLDTPSWIATTVILTPVGSPGQGFATLRGRWNHLGPSWLHRLDPVLGGSDTWCPWKLPDAAVASLQGRLPHSPLERVTLELFIGKWRPKFHFSFGKMSCYRSCYSSKTLLLRYQFSILFSVPILSQPLPLQKGSLAFSLPYFNGFFHDKKQSHVGNFLCIRMKSILFSSERLNSLKRWWVTVTKERQRKGEKRKNVKGAEQGRKEKERKSRCVGS